MPDERAGAIRGPMGAAGEEENVPLEEISRQIVGEGEGREEMQKESEGNDIRPNRRMAFGSQLARPFGEIGKYKLEPYDSEAMRSSILRRLVGARRLTGL